MVIPVEGAASALLGYVANLHTLLPLTQLKAEVVIVSAHEVAGQQQSAQLSLVFVRCLPEVGKGGMIKRGLFASSAPVVIVLEEANLDCAAIISNIDWVHRGFDVVVGSLGKFPGPAFNWACRTILAPDMAIDPSGYKIISRRAIGPLLGRTYLEDRGFDIELAYLIKRINYNVKVIELDRSTVLPGANPKMFWDLLRIRNWHFTRMNLGEEHMSLAELEEMYAQERDHWWFTAKAEFLKKIMALHVPKKSKILDAGCGTGHHMRSLATQGFYVGYDVSLEALNFCQRNGHNILVQGHLQEMPFAKESFDVVLTLDVLEHTQNPWSVIRQLHKVLHVGGKIVVTVPACRFLFGPHDEALSHLRRYDPKDLRRLLTEAGFKIERLGYLYCLPFIPVTMVRVFRKLFVQDESPKSDMFFAPTGLINRLMQKLLSLEAKLVGHLLFPFGTTLYAVAVRKEGA